MNKIEKEPEHKFSLGTLVYWKGHKLQGEVVGQSVGWNPPLAYIRIGDSKIPQWISEEKLERIQINPSRRDSIE